MSEFRVDPKQLQSNANDLRQLNAQFKSTVADLESTEATLSGMWDGPAKEAFRKAFMSDKAQMDTFYQAIDEYATRLESIASKYQTAENKNTEIANNRTY